MQISKSTPARPNADQEVEEVYSYVNGQNNPISSYKLNYIKDMRLDLCDPDMI